jgi:hypothetical protein
VGYNQDMVVEEHIVDYIHPNTFAAVVGATLAEPFVGFDMDDRSYRHHYTLGEEREPSWGMAGMYFHAEDQHASDMENGRDRVVDVGYKIEDDQQESRKLVVLSRALRVPGLIQSW